MRELLAIHRYVRDAHWRELWPVAVAAVFWLTFFVALFLRDAP